MAELVGERSGEHPGDGEGLSRRAEIEGVPDSIVGTYSIPAPGHNATLTDETPGKS